MWQKIRRLGFEIYCFFTAPFVLKNCLSILGAGMALLLMTLWWLQCYTNHGESVQVPNYIGMNVAEAAKKARNRNFRIALSDSTYIPGKPPGQVIAQDPSPESRVKEGRTIYFDITKNNPDIVVLPKWKENDSYELYSRKCVRLGLKPRIVARVPRPDYEPNTIVEIIHRGDTISNDIELGYSIEMGATLDFVVSEQLALTVDIPDCVCQTFDAAKFLITSSNLNIGSVIKDATVIDEDMAYVYRQTPAYIEGDTIRVGEQIDLYLTQDIPDKCIE